MNNVFFESVLGTAAVMQLRCYLSREIVNVPKCVGIIFYQSIYQMKPVHRAFPVSSAKIANYQFRSVSSSRQYHEISQDRIAFLDDKNTLGQYVEVSRDPRTCLL